MREKLHLQIIAGFTTFLALAFAVSGADASVLNSCTTYCHGMPPRDGARKANPHFDSQSSAFSGNHRNHLPPAPVAANCSVCHTPVSSTDFGHQNGIINMANSLKGYSSVSIRARYDKGLFINQTSIPNLAAATCSNVSCHFEAQSPAWSTAPLAYPAACSVCHGVPPSGGATGTAGSHARHDAYFPGATGCQKCHPSYTAFSHASSAGRPLRVQGYLRDPANNLEAAGTYSGTGTNYLPSQSGSQVFGNCSNLYCHSSGQADGGAGVGTAVTTGNWGSAVLNCGSCHKNMASDATATGKHVKHAQAAAISCSTCHGAGYSSTGVPTGLGTTHVNRNVNLYWTGLAATPATTYSKGSSFAAGISAYGTCSTSYCHSTVQNAADGTNAAVTYRSGFSWNAVSTLNCGGCHVDEANDATGTGSHRSHTLATGLNADCTRCHLGYTKTASNGAIHANGSIDLGAAGINYSQGSGNGHQAGNGYGSCSATVCHGQGAPVWGATSAAPINGFPFSANQCEKCHGSTATNPFYSTAIPKSTSNTDPKVGAHTAHITASERLHPGLLCIDCHGVVNLNDPTHMNGATNFNWSVLARTGNLSPSYDPATGKCSNVYCHGGHMPGGDTKGSNRTPTWNDPTYLPVTLSAVGCGTCHGFPPPTSAGHPNITLPAGFPATPLGTTCNCHANINQQTSGPTTYANVFNDPALHINGILDGGACTSCHGYPPVSAVALASSGKLGNWTGARLEDYPGGGGAHAIANHVNKLARPSDGFAYCIKCHSPTDHLTVPNDVTMHNHITVTINSRYRLEAGKLVKYTSNRLISPAHITGTCSNISCHYGATPKWDPAH
jgi:predicted CxxxxCH...CXXCH cytochrome family protein